MALGDFDNGLADAEVLLHGVGGREGCDLVGMLGHAGWEGWEGVVV